MFRLTKNTKGTCDLADQQELTVKTSLVNCEEVGLANLFFHLSCSLKQIKMRLACKSISRIDFDWIETAANLLQNTETILPCLMHILYHYEQKCSTFQNFAPFKSRTICFHSKVSPCNVSENSTFRPRSYPCYKRSVFTWLSYIVRKASVKRENFMLLRPTVFSFFL